MLPIGGMRAGCWINMIMACGLALLPEASAGCTCSFPIRSTIVMAPKREERAWSIYVTTAPLMPVKHWYINLGAPGDRKDAEGRVWFGYPRLNVGYGVKFDLHETLAPGGAFFSHSPEGQPPAGTELPWVYASGVEGLTRCEIALREADDEPATYRVTLGFCEPLHEKAGKRRFDIKLQGKVVAKDFDIAAEAGGRQRVVERTFEGIAVRDRLTIELVPHGAAPDELPLLNAIEIVRE